MKRALLALFMLSCVVAAPVRTAQAEPLLRSVVVSCAFGASTLAAATYAQLVPALATPVLTVPATEVIAANAMVGCGLGVAGAVSANLIAKLYDFLL
jgi:hypothetical protein